MGNASSSDDGDDPSVYIRVSTTKNKLKYCLDGRDLSHSSSRCGSPHVLPKFFKNGRRQKGDHKAKKNANQTRPIAYWKAQWKSKELKAKDAAQHGKDIKDAAVKRKAAADEAMRKSKAELRRLFPPGEGDRLFVWRGDSPSWLTLGVRDLGLVCRAFANPGPLDWTQPMESWLVIGTNARACEDEMLRVQKQGQRDKDALERRREEERLMQEAKEEEDFKELTKRVARASQISENEWDVTGQYKITCEDLDNYSDDYPHEYSLTIYRK